LLRTSQWSPLSLIVAGDGFEPT